MLLGWSHVHTSPVNVCAPAVGAGAGAVAAQPAKRRTIATVVRTLMSHLRVVERRSDDSRRQNIQTRCQHDSTHISRVWRPPAGNAVTELCELALTTHACARN